MKRKLLCELSPLAYRLSTQKEILRRSVRDLFSRCRFAAQKSDELLPVTVYSHRSLIRRRLGNVDMALQENKAVNLALAAPHINDILIRPGEMFSFWRLVGSVSRRKGYRTGLTIKSGLPDSDIGGGMCQLTNLIHWLVLHSPLTICEHHHHDGVDLFPDFGRVVPFGTGTSILYNYKDYRFRNDTSYTFQLLLFTDEEYLNGRLLCSDRLPQSRHIRVEDEYFSEENGVVYRNNTIRRRTVDVATGNIVADEVIKTNHARVLYDTDGLVIRRTP